MPARAALRTRLAAGAAILALTAAGWAALGLMLNEGGVQDIFAMLCRADAAAAAIGPVFILAMWGAMILAMMLPTAAPMVLTYAEIAQTAARKGERIVPTLVLIAGYIIVWLGYALAVTALQAGLAQLELLDSATAAAQPLVRGGILLIAGAYEFSALKHACLRQCQRPFPFFFAHWADTARGVFLLGVRQGLLCLGCCWAVMLVMVAVGAMNLAWMLVLGLVMAAEKLTGARSIAPIAGTLLIVAGLAVVCTGAVS